MKERQRDKIVGKKLLQRENGANSENRYEQNQYIILKSTN